MIPLLGSAPPKNREELVDALTRGLGRVFDLPAGRAAVAVEGGDYPNLHRLSFDVTGATAKKDFRPRPPGGVTHSVVTAAALRVVGRPLTVERAYLDFELVAQGVRFDVNHDAAEHWLDPADAEQGHFQSQISRSNLETLLLNGGQEEVAKHGLKIEKVELTLQDRGTRSVYTEVRVTASTKMAFATLRAVVRGQGEVVIDDALNLAIRGLTFTGEGIAGKMAAGLAQKFLRDWDGWSFPLSSLALGRLRLHDVRLGCRDGIQVEAKLGSEG